MGISFPFGFSRRREKLSRVTFTALTYESMLKMSRQKRITAEPEDLDEDNSIQTADVTEPTLANRRKLKEFLR